jgi:hypothetical protein
MREVAKNFDAICCCCNTAAIIAPKTSALCVMELVLQKHHATTFSSSSCSQMRSVSSCLLPAPSAVFELLGKSGAQSSRAHYIVSVTVCGAVRAKKTKGAMTMM